MMKNDVYFIVIALLVAKLFKILGYANEITCDVSLWTQNDVKITKCGMSVQILLSKGLKFCRVHVLQELHILIIVMMSP